VSLAPVLQRIGSLVVDSSDVLGFRRLVLGLALSGRLDSLAERPGSCRPSSDEDDLIAEEAANALQVDSLKCRFERLRTVAELKKGLTPIQQAKPGPYPLVVTADAWQACDHADFDGAAVVIPMVSSSGHGNASLKRLHYQEGQFALGSILCAAFPRESWGVSARFLYEYLTAFKDELLVSRMVGTANVSLTIAQIGQIPVPIVSRPSMDRLDELMALCDELEAAQTEREARRDRLRTTSLRNLVAPDESKENARFFLRHSARMIIRPEHVAGVRQAILDLAVRGRLVPQEEADRPWMPWQDVLLKENGAFRRGPFGSTLTKAIFVSSGYKVYEQYCPINDDCSFARYFVTPEKYRQLTSFAVRSKDFLISCSGSLGRITQVPNVFDEGIINQALLRVRIDNSLIGDAFFKMVFRSPYFQDQMLANSIGTAIPNVRGVKELKAIRLPVPPLAEQQRIVAKVDELMAVCNELERSLATEQTERARLLEALLHDVLEDALPARELELLGAR